MEHFGRLPSDPGNYFQVYIEQLYWDANFNFTVLLQSTHFGFRQVIFGFLIVTAFLLCRRGTQDTILLVM